MSQKFQHTVAYVGGQVNTYWATFHRRDGTKLEFFEGARIVSVGVNAGGGALVTTEKAHSLLAGERVRLQGVEGAVPDVNKEYLVQTVPSTTTFTILEATTTAGANGSCGKKMQLHAVEGLLAYVAVGRFDDQTARELDYT